MIRNTMLFDQGQKVLRRKSGQSRLAEMRIGRQKVFRPAMQIGEIAPAATGDEDLLAYAVGTFEHRHPPPAFAGFDSAHEPRGAPADPGNIESRDQFSRPDLSSIAALIRVRYVLL